MKNQKSKNSQLALKNLNDQKMRAKREIGQKFSQIVSPTDNNKQLKFQ